MCEEILALTVAEGLQETCPSCRRQLAVQNIFDRKTLLKCQQYLALKQTNWRHYLYPS